jgi:hypothetical protein
MIVLRIGLVVANVFLIFVLTTNSMTNATTVYSNATDFSPGYQGAQLPTGEFPSEVYQQTVRTWHKLSDIITSCSDMSERSYEIEHNCGIILHDFNERMQSFFLNNSGKIDLILYG